MLNLWRSLLFVAAIMAVLAGVGMRAEPRAAETHEAEWLRMHGLLSDGDVATMLDRLKAPAADGDAPSQRLLGIALLLGPEPFQAAQVGRLCEARYWLRRARTTSLDTEDAALVLLDRMRLDCDAAPAGARPSTTD